MQNSRSGAKNSQPPPQLHRSDSALLERGVLAGCVLWWVSVGLAVERLCPRELCGEARAGTFGIADVAFGIAFLVKTAVSGERGIEPKRSVDVLR